MTVFSSFRAREVPFEGLSEDLVADLFHDRLDLLIVRGAVPRAVVGATVSGLEAGVPEWTVQTSPEPNTPQLNLMGMSLTPQIGFDNGPPLSLYLDKAAALSQQLQVMTGVDLFGPARAALSRAAGGRAVGTPAGPDGRPYTAATVRRLPPECAIPVHVGRAFLPTGGYDHLRPLINAEVQLSWFVTLQTPAGGGGELVVHDLEFGDPSTPWADEGIVAADEITDLPSVRFRPEAGDLLVFDGGRYFHHVSPVGGDRNRYTFGGFLGRARDGRLWTWN